ncbi:MAG: zf-HC2 domain-containing protein [Acidobacteriota bacterium]
MSCTHVQDLLPWFANGSLDEEERRQVETHLAGCAACRSTLADIVALGHAASQHLPIDLLLDLADGAELAAADAERIRDHLAACPTCRAELAWARLEDEPPAPLAFPDERRPPDPPGHQPRTRSSPWRALAATVLVALSTAWLMTWEPWSSSSELDRRLHAPLINTQLLELVPETLRRGRSETPTLSLDSESPFVTLALISEVRPPADADLFLKFVGPVAESWWAYEGPERTDAGLYTVLLPASLLGPGEYRVSIVVGDAASGEVLEEFRFQAVQ